MTVVVPTISLGLVKLRAPLVCDYHYNYDADDEPLPPRCGAAAEWLIIWDDGQYSFGCPEHVKRRTFTDDAWVRIVEMASI